MFCKKKIQAEQNIQFQINYMDFFNFLQVSSK